MTQELLLIHSHLLKNFLVIHLMKFQEKEKQKLKTMKLNWLNQSYVNIYSKEDVILQIVHLYTDYNAIHVVYIV